MPGGGVALLYASRALDAVREGLANFDQRIGVKIVQSALKVPCKTIADNAGAQLSGPGWMLFWAKATSLRIPRCNACVLVKPHLGIYPFII